MVLHSLSGHCTIIAVLSCKSFHNVNAQGGCIHNNDLKALGNEDASCLGENPKRTFCLYKLFSGSSITGRGLKAVSIVLLKQLAPYECCVNLLDILIFPL